MISGEILSGKFKDYAINILYILVFIDILMIVYLLFFDTSAELKGMLVLFDVILCAIMLFDFFRNAFDTSNKYELVKRNFIYFIACIPYELFLPAYFMSFRILLVLKLLRLPILERYFENFFNFLENTGLEHIMNMIIVVIFVFTFALYLIDSSFTLFDSLWFVMVTLTTVGYGDITPQDPLAKGVSLLLIIAGIFVFSTLTGAISSYYTDKVLNIDSDVEDGIDMLSEKVDNLESELSEIKEELKVSQKQNRQLSEKLDELLKK